MIHPPKDKEESGQSLVSIYVLARFMMLARQMLGVTESSIVSVL